MDFSSFLFVCWMADNDINQHGKQKGNHSQDIRFGNIDASKSFDKPAIRM